MIDDIEKQDKKYETHTDSWKPNHEPTQRSQFKAVLFIFLQNSVEYLMFFRPLFSSSTVLQLF